MIPKGIYVTIGMLGRNMDAHIVNRFLEQSVFNVTANELWYNSLGMNIKKIVRQNILSLSAYDAKDINCKVKLDANESPYGFDGLEKVVKSVKTNRYPDPGAKYLKKLIAGDLKVKPENILQGNGSDELIYYLITTFGGPVMYPVPTFAMYGIISQSVGESRIRIPLDEAFDLDTESIINAIRKEKPKLIFLSSPNNPTGNCFSADRILKVIDAARDKSIVVVDEAYQPFASDRGFIPMLNDYENLVVLRTLSKIGLAALRVGFLIANKEIIKEVNKVRLPYNLNSLSQAIACEVLKNKNMKRGFSKLIVSERKRLFSELSNIDRVNAYPSEANFILFKVNDADLVYKRLLKKGVLVRNMKGVVDGCLRVTVGSPEENSFFLKALKEVTRI